MKYIDAEKLKIFEEMLADIIVSSQGLCTYEACKDRAKIEAPVLIDSLQQEQPEVDLKKEIKEWTDLMVGASFPEQDGDFISEEDYRNVIRQTAIHFLELNARKEENK